MSQEEREGKVGQVTDAIVLSTFTVKVSRVVVQSLEEFLMLERHKHINIWREG